MEIKTTADIIDDQFITTKDKHTLRVVNSTRPREDIGKYRYKKWVAVDDMIKELNKYHNGLHPECNICKLINSLSKESKKEGKWKLKQL